MEASHHVKLLIMQNKLFILILLLSPKLFFAQNITDSVFEIKSISVVAGKLFDKKLAGMKEMAIDSSVFNYKVNLSLSELLSENTTVFIKNNGRGALATASFRGTSASHTQVTWNGININDPMTGMVDFSLIPVYVIDEMNVKYGTASVYEQSGGLGGSINIGNKVNWDNKFGLKYLQGFGSYSSFDEFLKVGFGNKNYQVKTRVYHNFSQNNFTFINRGIANIDPKTGLLTNPLDTNSNADYSKHGLLQEFYFRPDYRNIFSVKYWGQNSERTIPTATTYEGPDNSNLNNQSDETHKFVADWKHISEKSKFILQTGFSHKQLHYSLKNKVSGVGLISAVYSKSSQKSILNTARFNYNFNSSFDFESSLSYNYFKVSSVDTVKQTAYNTDRKELSAFLALHKNFAERLNINLMFRQEFIDYELQPIIPFLGFDFRILKGVDLFLKGNAARNYHTPSLNDLYWQPGGNSDLLPENGNSVEIGFEYAYKLNNKLLKTEITSYRSDIKNWIIWIPTYKGYWEPQNIKRVLSQGFEFNFSLKGKINNLTYKFSGNYAYTNSVNYGDSQVWGDESYGKQLVYVPLHSGNIFLNLAYKSFELNFQHNYFSERYTTSSNDISRRDWLYPYFMNDISVSKEFSIKKIKFSTEFKIYNLFNETYHSILYRPMPKRNYTFILIIKL